MLASNAIDILVNATDRASDTFKNIGSSVDGMAGAMQKAEGSSKALLGLVAGAVVGTIALGGRAVAQLAEIERISSQTDAVIKSTGGVANVTADEIATMAVEMQYLTSVEHEAIRQGANLLLTFTNIRNEAGEGNDIFNRTTGIMTDLSVAMGTDTKGAATMLGKALNDPMQGMTALSRVGVSFTQEQKDQVKALQESGDMLGAQKVILEELEVQYGGSAEALGGTFIGKLTMAKMAFDDMGQAIMDQLNTLDWLKGGLETVTTAMLNFGNSITENGISETLKTLIPEGMEGVLYAVGGAILVGLVPAFYALATAVWASIAPLLPFLAVGALVGLMAWQIMENWETFAPYFQGIFDFVGTAVEGFKSVFMTSFNTLLSGLTPLWESVKTLLKSLEPIIMLIGAVLGVLLVTGLSIFNGIVSAIAPLLTAFFNLLDVVVNVVNAVIAVLTGDWQGAMDYWNSATESAVEFFKNIWSAIKNFFSSFVSTFVSILSGFGIDVVGKFTEMWEGAKSKVSSGIDSVVGFFKGLPPKALAFIISLASKGIAKFNEMMNGARDKVNGGIAKIVSFFAGLPAKAMAFIIRLASQLVSNFTNMMNNARSRVSSGISSIVSFFSGLPSKAMAHIIRLASQLVSNFTSMMSNAKSAVSRGITNVINTVKNFGSQFLSAGKGLLKELVSGITSGIGKAKDAVKNGMDAIRSFLPFSPAKEGPLSDLDKSGKSFFPTWYEGALENLKPMQRAISGAMNDLNDSVESDTGSIGLEAFTGGKTKMTVTHRHEHSGVVQVKGDNNKDSVDFVKNDITTRTEETFTSDLRRVARSR